MYSIDDIKKKMKEKKVTLNQLSTMSKLPIGTLRSVIYKQAKNPRIDTMMSICRALGLEPPLAKDYYDGVSLESEMLVPLLGSVVAGVPIAAQQNIEEYIWISQRPANMYFGLRVHGDSMIDAGIRDKCILIVRKQEYADCGDIVVAMLNGEQTVKRFKKLGDMVFLMPENKNYDPIPVLPKDELLILGKVVEIRTIL